MLRSGLLLLSTARWEEYLRPPQQPAPSERHGIQSGGGRRDGLLGGRLRLEVQPGLFPAAPGQPSQDLTGLPILTRPLSSSSVSMRRGRRGGRGAPGEKPREVGAVVSGNQTSGLPPLETSSSLMWTQERTVFREAVALIATRLVRFASSMVVTGPSSTTRRSTSLLGRTQGLTEIRRNGDDFLSHGRTSLGEAVEKNSFEQAANLPTVRAMYPRGGGSFRAGRWGCGRHTPQSSSTNIPPVCCPSWPI